VIEELVVSNGNDDTAGKSNDQNLERTSANNGDDMEDCGQVAALPLLSHANNDAINANNHTELQRLRDRILLLEKDVV